MEIEDRGVGVHRLDELPSMIQIGGAHLDGDQGSLEAKRGAIGIHDTTFLLVLSLANIQGHRSEN